MGPWKGTKGAHAIPVTEKGQLLAVLDIRDPDHPRLKVMPAAESEPGAAETAETSETAETAEMVKTAAAEIESLGKGEGSSVVTRD